MDADMDPDELEIQMAIALSLAEVQGGAPDAVELAPGRAPPTSAQAATPTSAQAATPALAQAAVPTQPSITSPADDRNRMQAALAQALSNALLSGGSPGTSAPTQPANSQPSRQAPAAQASATQPQTQPRASSSSGGGAQPSAAPPVANELARQFAMFQQAMQGASSAGGGSSSNGATAGNQDFATMLAAALGGSVPVQPSIAAPQPNGATASRPSTAPAGPRPAARAAAAAAPTPAPSLPDWVQSLQQWWAPAGVAGPRSEVTLATSAELQTFLEALSKALGVKVMAAYEAGVPALVLKTTSAPGGGAVIRATDLQSVVGAWLRRPSLVASGTSQLRALHNAFDAIGLLNKSADSVGSALALTASVVGEAAFQLLAADEEDLYFDKGQHTSQLIKDLRTPARAGAGVSAAFLAAIAGGVRNNTGAAAMLKLLKIILAEAKSITALGASAVELEPLSLALDVITAPAAMQRCLASALAFECVAAARQPVGRGAQPASKTLEAKSVLTPLLHLSSLVEPLTVLTQRKVTSRAAATFSQLKGFPTNQGELESCIHVVGQLQARLQDVLHGLLKRLVTLKEGVAPGAGREAVLTWLVAGARLNWERTAAGERGIAAQVVQELTTGASDAWCVNVVAVCLRFSRPFVQGFWDTKANKFADLFTKHLNVNYYVTQPHRLPDLTHANSLAGERGRSVADAILELPASARPTTPAAPSAAPWFAAPPAAPSSATAAATPATAAPSFIADCFFVTQTWMHVGLLPALFRYQRLSESLSNSAKHEQQPEGPRGQLSPIMVQQHLLSVCERAALLEPTLVEDTVQFCLLQICWLHHLVQQPNAAAIFSLIPDYVLSDPLTWLSFIIGSGLAVHVASKDVGALTAALTALLDSPHAVRSPVLADKMGRLLLTMLAPQLDVSRKAAAAGGGHGALAPSMQRPGESALVASVLNSQAAQSGALASALMRAYVGADHVVGLDVDRDAFDKFTMRSCIDSILEELWRDERGRRTLVALASGQGDGKAGGDSAKQQNTFNKYVSCLFNSLIYLFKDSLDRLVDIGKVESARRDEAGWAARPKAERDQQEGFLRSQAQTCRGFMRIAVQALGWLNTLAQHPQTGAALGRPPLSGRVAYSVLHFVEVLAHSRAQQLQVDRPEQYLWNRIGLLSQVCGLATRLASGNEGPAFMAALVAEPDVDLGVLGQARDQLEAHHAVNEATSLTGLLEALAQRMGTAAPPLATPANTDVPARTSHGGELTPAIPPGGPPAKRSRIEDNNGASSSSLQQDADMTDASPPAADGAWELPGPVLSDAELKTQYTTQLGELQMGTFDAGAARAYYSAFNTMAAESAGSVAAAMTKRVSREVRDLSSGKTPLPCQPPASIFLRYDQDHMHKMRALITGPEGTPYAYGCFVFDLLFPPGYPNTPMLVHFETTGQGRARFNPNLYADGKVCLSLINTWHASHESEKWNPDITSTFQVLVSIQAMILVEDPYYNEPAHEAARGTDTGTSSAAAYNAALTLNTLRWSMIDKIRNPPPGMEDVVRTHFRLLRHKVLSQARRWAEAATATGDEALAKRTHAAVKELQQLLADL